MYYYKVILPKKLRIVRSSAKRTFEISFLPRVSRGKKHFYHSKCAFCRQSVRAAVMFRRKTPYGGFSTVYKERNAISWQ